MPTGFGAAKHLSQEGYSVTLIDGSPNPGGLSAGWRTDQGRAVEAGVKGFWFQVPFNTLYHVYSSTAGRTVRTPRALNTNVFKPFLSQHQALSVT